MSADPRLGWLHPPEELGASSREIPHVHLDQSRTLWRNLSLSVCGKTATLGSGSELRASACTVQAQAELAPSYGAKKNPRSGLRSGGSLGSGLIPGQLQGCWLWPAPFACNREPSYEIQRLPSDSDPRTFPGRRNRAAVADSTLLGGSRATWCRSSGQATDPRPAIFKIVTRGSICEGQPAVREGSVNCAQKRARPHHRPFHELVAPYCTAAFRLSRYRANCACGKTLRGAASGRLIQPARHAVNRSKQETKGAEALVPRPGRET